MRVLAVLLLAVLGSPGMAGDVEEPHWELVDTLGEVEIRQYAPSVQAVTRIRSSARTTEGFRRLAGYIFGDNERSQSIAMTAPVQESLTEGSPVMAFTMPSQYALDDLPAPTDQRIAIMPVPARTVAAIRFSGWATGGKVAKMRGELLTTLADHGIDTVGDPVLNQYNPPWTAPFLRRNEIAVQVSWDDEPASH